MDLQDNLSYEFDEFSKNYAKDMEACVPYYLQLTACFIKSMPASFRPTRILDLGCGNGIVTETLLSHYPEAHYTLVDASPEMINLCKRRFKGQKIELICSFFKNYCFEYAQYDLVVAGFSLHHCQNDEKKDIFKSVFTTLKKGGIFASSDLMISKKKPAHQNLYEKWERFVNSNFPDGEKWKWLAGHYDEFDYPADFDDQKKWLAEAGFKNVSKETFEIYWTHFKAFKL